MQIIARAKQFGSVDILSQEDASGDEMNACEIAAGELVEAAKVSIGMEPGPHIGVQ